MPGLGELRHNKDDVLSALGTEVFGSPLDKILIIAVLTSAAASTQTTILPTARTTLSMARSNAMPSGLGKVHPRFLTPHVSTILMGVASIVWYVTLTILSEDILFDSLAALGLMISFYLGITGFACAIFYRRELLNSVKNFLFIGVGPAAGGAILFYLLIKNAIDLSDPANSESGNSWLGLGPPLVIAIFFAVLGIILMLWQWRAKPEFFRRRPETVSPELVARAPGSRRELRWPASWSGYDGTIARRRPSTKRSASARISREPVLVAFGYGVNPMGGEVKDHAQALRELGEKVTGEAVERARAGGAEAEAVLADQEGSEALIAVAKDRDARMIVVGGHGEGPIRGAILGSTAYRLVHLSETPVLVVRS